MMFLFKTLLYTVVSYQVLYFCTAIDTYCPPPVSNVTDAVKTFIKYHTSDLPEGWYPSEVRYACNDGLGPHTESVCQYTYNTIHEVEWTPPIEELLQLNCSGTNYTANETDTVETLCSRHGGYYIESKRRCLIIPHLNIHGNERYETCDRLATLFGNQNLQGRPWIVEDDEAFNILMNTVFGPNRAMRNSSGDAAFGPSSNYKDKISVPAGTSVLHGYWLNGNRVYPDAGTCDTVDYCTEDVIEAKGPGNHTEMLNGSWVAPGVYDLWTSDNGVNISMCVLAHGKEIFDVAANTYSKVVWMETVFCDEVEINPLFALPATMPVICELLIWPIMDCEAPAVSADVVLLNGSSPVVTNMSLGESMSVKCSLPAAYVVADGQAFTQLDIVCIQPYLELTHLNHKVITCAQVGCGNITVSNGVIAGIQTKPELGFVVGEVATVVCDDGYDTEVKDATSVMCIQDNSTVNSGNFTLKWNATTPECIPTSPCKQEDLKLPCGADHFIFEHTNGTETKDIQQATYPHGTKVHTECHHNCPGQSDKANPTGVRECRFGKWHNCFHKCMCNCSSATVIKCLQWGWRRGWSGSLSDVVEWRRYANPSKCCKICSLYNRNNGTTNDEEKCLAFNLRKVQYGVECQFFNQTDTNLVFDRQFHYFNLVV